MSVFLNVWYELYASVPVRGYICVSVRVCECFRVCVCESASLKPGTHARRKSRRSHKGRTRAQGSQKK